MDTHRHHLAALNREQLHHPDSIAPRATSCEHLVEHHAHREEIAPDIEDLALEILRRDVPELALHDVRRRPPRTVDRQGDSEVAELDLAFV